jgi:hypothetical protein
MHATLTSLDLIDARRAALQELDATVREELTALAHHWDLGDVELVLTPYDRVYGRTPSAGGHWTLFTTRLTAEEHEVATVTVTAEFEDAMPVDLRVNGTREALAGGCHALALREALSECGGPLRQVTPLTIPTLAAASAATMQMLLGQ